MATSADRTVDRALEYALQQAVRAPSVHNTQPWRFTVKDSALEIFADWTRQLSVLDPQGRELLLSCGAAVHTARVALAAAGHDCVIERYPDPTRSDLLARVTLCPATPDSRALAELAPHVTRRTTNRRRFGTTAVPDEVIQTLVAVAPAHSASLVPITRDSDRVAIARLSQLADQRQILDPAYRAELRAWTTDDPHRHDGVYSMTVPHVAAGTPDALPIRDFDTHGHGYLPVDSGADAEGCLLVLGTYSDDALAWLRSGEAMQHVLLEITRLDCVASPLTQIVEDEETRAELRAMLVPSMYPHVLLRVGHAAPTPGSLRRPLSSVVDTDP